MQSSEAGMARALLMRDPLLLGQILLARAKVILLPVPRTAVQRRVGGVTFEFDFSDETLLDSFQHSRPAMHAMIHGSYEPTLRRVLRRLLRPGGIFIDAGANIGYVSAVAASLVGPTGQVHSFEPVPPVFRRLRRLAELNPGYRFTLNNHALGAEDGDAVITVKRGNIGGNTLVPGQIEPEHQGETYAVPIRRLGDYLTRYGLARPSLIKIDVEGFEYQVLRGMADYFAGTDYRPPIVCEVNADAAAALGYTLGEMADHMASLGYSAYRLTDLSTPIDLTTIDGFPNLLFAPAGSLDASEGQNPMVDNLRRIALIGTCLAGAYFLGRQLRKKR